MVTVTIKRCRQSVAIGDGFWFAAGYVLAQLRARQCAGVLLHFTGDGQRLPWEIRSYEERHCLFIKALGEWCQQRCDDGFVARLLAMEGASGVLHVEWLPLSSKARPPSLARTNAGSRV